MTDYSIKAETGILGKPKDPKFWIGKRVKPTAQMYLDHPQNKEEFDFMGIGTAMEVFTPDPTKPGVVVTWANGWRNPWELSCLDIIG